MKLLKNPWLIRLGLAIASLLLLTTAGLTIYNVTQLLGDLQEVENRYLFSWYIEPLMWVIAMFSVAFFASSLVWAGKSEKTRHFLRITAIVTASITVTVGIAYLFYTVIPLHYWTFTWPYLTAYVLPTIAISTLMTAFVGFHETKIRAIASRAKITLFLLISSWVLYYFTHQVDEFVWYDQYFVAQFATGGLFLLALILFGLGRSEQLWEVFVCKAYPPIDKRTIRQHRKKKKRK